VVAETRRALEISRREGIDIRAEATRLAVVGAAGNIGSALASRLCAHFCNVLLVGRRRDALEGLRGRLLAAYPGCQLDVATDMASLQSCNVISLAVATTEPVLLPQHVSRDRKVLVLDVSVPSVVSPQLRRLSNVRIVPGSGTVAMPATPDFVVSSHTREGRAFCCAAEAMLLGLSPERIDRLALTGEIDPMSLAVLEELGESHGLLHPV